jgi:hypothetical protein
MSKHVRQAAIEYDRAELLERLIDIGRRWHRNVTEA